MASFAGERKRSVVTLSNSTVIRSRAQTLLLLYLWIRERLHDVAYTSLRNWR